MTKLIDHMLDFARLEMKSGKYAEEAVDMEELVASICSDMKLIREKEIMLDYETDRQCFMEIVNFYPEFSLILSAMPIVMGKRMGISL